MLYHSQTQDSEKRKFTLINFLDQNEKQNVTKLQMVDVTYLFLQTVMNHVE